MKTIEEIGAIKQAGAMPTRMPRANEGSDHVQVKSTRINGSDDFISLSGKSLSQSGYAALNARKEAVNQRAAGVRELGQAQRLAETAKEQLDLVVKSFPPFPPGSMEREQYLNSVAGIRSIIEKLTIPPEPRERLADALGQEALINSQAGNDLLPAGLDGLNRAQAVLASVQVDFQQDLFPSQATSDDEAVAQSRQVGAELLRQGRAISRSAEAVQALVE